MQHLEIHRTSLEERKKFVCEYEGCTKRYTKVYIPLKRTENEC